MRKPRSVVVIALAALALAFILPASRYWYFRQVDHIRVSSPDGQWVVCVTKRMENIPEPVEVRLRIVQTSVPEQEWFDEEIDSPDCWEDVKPGSYAVEWVSPHEFRIGGRDPSEGFGLRYKFDGRTWVSGFES